MRRILFLLIPFLALTAHADDTWGWNTPAGLVTTVEANFGLISGTNVQEALESIDDNLGGSSTNAYLTSVLSGGGCVVSVTSGVATVTVTNGLGSIATATGGVPAGCTVMYMGELPEPSGWLLCAGQSVRIVDYTNLYATIGVLYGGNGNTTFNLPDMRGLFVRGWNNSRAGTYADPDADNRKKRGDGTTGDAVGTLQKDQNASHTHVLEHLYGRNDGDGSVNKGRLDVGGNQEDIGGENQNEHALLSNSGGDEARPNNISVMYIIKY